MPLSTREAGEHRPKADKLAGQAVRGVIAGHVAAKSLISWKLLVETSLARVDKVLADKARHSKCWHDIDEGSEGSSHAAVRGSGMYWRP
jgi:hypothetical protein